MFIRLIGVYDNTTHVHAPMTTGTMRDTQYSTVTVDVLFGDVAHSSHRHGKDFVVYYDRD